MEPSNQYERNPERDQPVPIPMNPSQAVDVTDQYERIISGVLLCLSDHYSRALRSGCIAFRLNGHNSLPSSDPDWPTSCPYPADFGTVLLIENLYIHPCRDRVHQAWTHGELHIKLSVDFGDGQISIEEKIQGGGQQVLDWGRDVQARLHGWAIGTFLPGFFKVFARKMEIEEWEGSLGSTNPDFIGRCGEAPRE